jgi:hypothetical protein
MTTTNGSRLLWGALALLSLLFLGCEKVGVPKLTKWWVGAWTLDETYTADRYKVARETQRENTPVEGTGIGEFFSNLAGRVTDEAVVESLHGIALTITETEFILTKNGNGTARTYTTLESPGVGKQIIKLSDGSVLTLTQEEKYLTLVQDRGVPIRLYFLKTAP